MLSGPESIDGVLPLIDCDLALESPWKRLSFHDELTLCGWAVSPKGISGVAVQVGDRQWTAAYGLDTPNLARRLSGIPGADRAGYRLEIDTSGWAPGAYHVTVAAFDVEGGRSALEGPVDILPFEPVASAAMGGEEGADGPVIVLDRPQPAAGRVEVEGPLEVSGWAHSEAGIETVAVTVDGCRRYEALRPIARPDLLAELGPDAAEAGFVLRLDPVELAPGDHHLAVVAVSRDGRVRGVERDLRCLPAAGAATASDGPVPVDWLSERVVPKRADEVASAGEQAEDAAAGHGVHAWRDRALLAEADAAASRAQTGLAEAAQVGVARALHATRHCLDDARAELVRVEAESAARAEALQSLTASLSWRLTRPLRLAKHGFRRLG